MTLGEFRLSIRARHRCRDKAGSVSGGRQICRPPARTVYDIHSTAATLAAYAYHPCRGRRIRGATPAHSQIGHKASAILPPLFEIFWIATRRRSGGRCCHHGGIFQERLLRVQKPPNAAEFLAPPPRNHALSRDQKRKSALLRPAAGPGPLGNGGNPRFCLARAHRAHLFAKTCWWVAGAIASSNTISRAPTPISG